jgi:hypothetical protein
VTLLYGLVIRLVGVLLSEYRFLGVRVARVLLTPFGVASSSDDVVDAESGDNKAFFSYMGVVGVVGVVDVDADGLTARSQPQLDDTR